MSFLVLFTASVLPVDVFAPKTSFSPDRVTVGREEEEEGLNNGNFPRFDISPDFRILGERKLVFPTGMLNSDSVDPALQSTGVRESHRENVLRGILSGS